MMIEKCLRLALVLSILLTSLLGLTISLALAEEETWIGIFPPKLGRAVERPLNKYLFTPLESTVGMFSLGDYIFDPIEEQIPNLRLQGVLRNRTWRYLHGPTGDTGIVGPPIANRRVARKNRFAMIEWLSELEAHYYVKPELELVTIFDYRYDSVFDWDKNWRYSRTTPYRGFPEEVETELAYLHRTKEILREAYLNYMLSTEENGSWNFKFGKQQLGLGKQDFNVIDIISSRFTTDSPISSLSASYPT